MSKINQETVIKSVRQKTDDGYETPVYFGVEQRFVEPIRGSNGQIHNLEEQYILGTNTYTVASKDSETGDQKIVKSFCTDPETDSDFYQLETIIYKKREADTSDVFEFIDDAFVIPAGQRTRFNFNNKTLECTVIPSDPICGFSEDNEFQVYPTYFLISEKSELSYINGNKTKIPVSEKTVGIRLNSRNETITRETITNKLVTEV